MNGDSLIFHFTYLCFIFKYWFVWMCALCMCVYSFGCACTGMGTYMLRSEVNVGSLPLSLFHLITWEKVFPWTWSSPVCYGILGIWLLPPGQHWDDRCMPPHLALPGGWASELKVPWLCDRYFTDWDVPSTLFVIIFYVLTNILLKFYTKSIDYLRQKNKIFVEARLKERIQKWIENSGIAALI